MIWTSYIYEKKYKWLSFNLWFFYLYFYKNFFFFKLDSEKQNPKHFIEFNTFVKNKQNKYVKIEKINNRFNYYIDLYCIEFFNYIILLNLYFETQLKY
jgi:hypothetical protein